ncbi:hypothetical protein BDR04DRAFT_1094079 [Suillus decipiens]|nr:hypothetical protein BDR04DRAFT_1094079 [Suillus decipiens]
MRIEGGMTSVFLDTFMSTEYWYGRMPLIIASFGLMRLCRICNVLCMTVGSLQVVRIRSALANGCH